jgi:hydrogenase nickel incorporation protein HypA/HybF
MNLPNCGLYNLICYPESFDIIGFDLVRATLLNQAFRESFPMHEWALAEAVINAASEIAEKEGLKQITKVTVRTGELQQVEPEILEFAFSQLKTAKFKNTVFEIETEKARFKCRTCGHTWVFNKKNLGKNESEAIHFVPEIAHTYIRCPKCGSPDFETQEGRGVVLQSIKGVK